MANIYKQIIQILILALVLGFIRNIFLEEPLPLVKKERILETIKMDKTESGEFKFELPEDLTEPLNVTIHVVKYLQLQNNSLIIDARDEEEFNIGKIEDAINIPYDYYEDFEYQLDDIDLEKILIIYCSGGECSLSIDLADYLMQERGFFNVLIYEGGWPEWKESGLPSE
jgi:rhodanese-related sulfurtransferase